MPIYCIKANISKCLNCVLILPKFALFVCFTAKRRMVLFCACASTEIAMFRLNLNSQSSTTSEVGGVCDILFTYATIKSVYPYHTFNKCVISLQNNVKLSLGARVFSLLK